MTDNVVSVDANTQHTIPRHLNEIGCQLKTWSATPRGKTLATLLEVNFYYPFAADPEVWCTTVGSNFPAGGPLRRRVPLV